MVPSTLAKASDTDAVPPLALAVVVVSGSIVAGDAVVSTSVSVVVAVVTSAVGAAGFTVVVCAAGFAVVDAGRAEFGAGWAGRSPDPGIVVTKLTTSAKLLCCIEAKSNFLPYNPIEMPNVAIKINTAKENHCGRLPR